MTKQMTPEAIAKWRFCAESLIERAITILEEIDGDVDLEDGGDHEPYLAGSRSDLEDDPAQR